MTLSFTRTVMNLYLSHGNTHLYSIPSRPAYTMMNLSTSTRVNLSNVLGFALYNYIGVTPHWECTIVRGTSPFILIAVALRRVSPIALTAELRQ